MTEFWVVLEFDGTVLHEASYELLNEVVKCAQSQPGQATVCAVLLQAKLPDITRLTGLTALGVKRLYLLEHPQLAQYITNSYVEALAWLVQRNSPALLAAIATPNGRDWTPRLAARLRLPLVSCCLTIELRDDTLFTLRTLYGGRAYAQTHTALHRRTALVTLVPRVHGAPANTENQELEIVRLTPEVRPRKGVEHIRYLAPSPEEIELDAAERIVAGGRGVGREGFSTIADFAHRLGAAVGATRVAADQGWVEHERQIGTTGKVVRPKLYIACGISGATQHTSGMSETQTVIAINPDRTAPIFALADLGLLGDANQILPLAAKLLMAPIRPTNDAQALRSDDAERSRESGVSDHLKR